MNREKTIFARWYGGGNEKIRNVICNIGHLSLTGFIIPKYKYYEYKN